VNIFMAGYVLLSAISKTGLITWLPSLFFFEVELPLPSEQKLNSILS
jgi:hypothetical protein